MFYRTLSFTSLIALAACGGSSSSEPTLVPVTPISPSGFASETRGLEDVATLNIVDQRRIVSDGTENLSLDVQDITISDLNNGNDEIAITIDGQTFVLEGIEGTSTFSFDDGTNLVEIFSEGITTPDASVIGVFALLDGELNAASLVIGLDTNPDVIDALSGSAEFDGVVDVTTRTGFTDGFGGGQIALDVDFDAMTVGGELEIFDIGNSSSETFIPNVTFDIAETDITGNGFETSLTFNPDESLDQLDGTIVSAGINGRFYGAEGATLGGQIFGEIDNGEGEFPTLVEGAYVAIQ